MTNLTVGLQNSASGLLSCVPLWFSPEGCILQKNTDTAAAMQLQGPTKQPKLRFLSKWPISLWNCRTLRLGFTLPSWHVSLWFSPEGCILQKNTDTAAAMQLQGPTKQPKLRFLSKWPTNLRLWNCRTLRLGHCGTAELCDWVVYVT